MKIVAFTMLILASASVWKKPADAQPEPPRELTAREKVLKVAGSQVGIKERTGKNDGEVEKYIASVGLDPTAGYPYCAAFTYWCGCEALGKDNPYPKSAWSPDTVKGGRRVNSGTEIQGAETFGIYNALRKRIAHTGFVEKRVGSHLITIEANTSANAAVGSEADREGQGVYRKRRHIKTVRTIKDWHQ